LKLASQPIIALDPSSMVKEKAPDQLSHAEKKTLKSTAGAAVGLAVVFWETVQTNPIKCTLGVLFAIALILAVFRHYKAEETPIMPIHGD
jgi:hypothetical protein